MTGEIGGLNADLWSLVANFGYLVLCEGHDVLNRGFASDYVEFARTFDLETRGSQWSLFFGGKERGVGWDDVVERRAG